MNDAMKKLAAKGHAGQVRKGNEGIPFIEHPKAVVQNLLDWGEPEDSPAVSIAWGHDLIEDTGTTEEEIFAVSNEQVLDGIRLLSCPPEMDKRSYLKKIAESRCRDVLLVKLSDRIHNTGDFIRLKGKLHAFRYLHETEGIWDAAKNIPQDAVLSKAVMAWRDLGKSLRNDARHDAIRGCLLGGSAATNNGKGCGTVMRVALAGLSFDPETAYEFGCRFSALKHGHTTGITAGGAFAMLIAGLLAGKLLDDAIDAVLDLLDTQKDAEKTAAALRKARTAKHISEFGEGWVAEEALAIGVYCARRHPWNFKAGILEAVNITGNGDLTGAIAGNILGVMKGESGIPGEWLLHLREKEIIAQVADDLWKRIECNSSGYATKE